MYYLSISGVNANGTCRFKIFLTCTQIGLGRKIYFITPKIVMMYVVRYFPLPFDNMKVWFYLQIIKQDKCNNNNNN